MSAKYRLLDDEAATLLDALKIAAAVSHQTDGDPRFARLALLAEGVTVTRITVRYEDGFTF